MGLTLAAMLGQIGLPGGGFGHGYGSMNEPGLATAALSGCRRCRRATTRCRTFIPVAAVSDMLLHPGETFDYNGLRLTYPDIQLVYWAGGNPFHHHQNLPRLRRALGPRRHRRRARPVLDGDGQARRHRRAVDHRLSSATTTPVRATTRC